MVYSYCNVVIAFTYALCLLKFEGEISQLGKSTEKSTLRLGIACLARADECQHQDFKGTPSRHKLSSLPLSTSESFKIGMLLADRKGKKFPLGDKLLR